MALAYGFATLRKRFKLLTFWNRRIYSYVGIRSRMALQKNIGIYVMTSRTDVSTYTEHETKATSDQN